MNKKNLLKTVTLTSAVLATGVVSFSGAAVRANTLDSTSPTANATETPTTNQVTAEQVATAKTDVNTAEEAVKNQEPVVTSALSDKQAAQTVEAEAQETLVAAQATAETATPEAIQAVEAEIVEAETTVSETEALLESTKQEASTAQTQADQAQAVADTANTSYTEAQAQADAAQETVTQLENQTVNVEQAQASVDTAKQDVATAEAAVAEAEQAVVEAEAKDQTLAQDIAEAKTALDTAKDAESNAQTTVAGLEAQVTDTANKVTEAQEVVDSLQNEVSYNVDINLPQNVKDAVKKFLSETRTLETVAELKQVIESAQIRENIEQYWTLNITGGDEIVDLDNLTTKQIEQLNQFAVDVYNTLAETIGLTTITANTKMIELAKVRSEMYDAKDAEFGHDRTILRESERVVFPNTTITAGENLASNIYRTAPTFRELMEGLNTSMVYMTLIDSRSNYGHWNNFDKAKSIGLYVHNEESMDLGGYTANHYKPWYVFAIYRDQFTGEGLFTDAVEANELVHSADVTFTSDTSALTTAKTQLAIANVAHNRAKADLAQAVTALNDAKADVVSATNAYNDLLSTESETTKAQANLDEAKTKLSEANAKYNSAKLVLAALTESKEAKEQALTEAKAAFDTAQAKADELRADYLVKQSDADELKSKAEQASQTVQALEVILEDAKQAVVDAKAKLVDMQEAEANLVKAQDAYEKAVKAREEAGAIYQQEAAKLTELQDNYSLAVKHYLNLLNLYNLQEQVKAPTEETGDDQGTVSTPGSSASGQNQNDTTVVTKGNSQAPLGTETPLNVTTIGASQKLDAQSGKVVTVNTTGMAPTSKEQTRSNDVEKAPVQAASLPQTGSNESILSSLAGFTVLGLGLSLAIKRRKDIKE
ncbi:TPA: SEC10/PgrA surface exclusion domain-containing protein [Streptococcus suis]|nr:SEC10/PgrA surface exclusion domain-containing protein [Streptococcus suis]HEM6437261.1 SEC10/PgrA surface exclusion domain-containing protein [Streptococcus suis]